MAEEQREIMELQDGILAVGRRLCSPPSDADELFALTDEAQRILSRFTQSPTESMKNALFPVMKAVVCTKLTRHADIGVRVGVTSCICEILRITAPNHSYSDNQMKEIFGMIVATFKELDDISNRLYPKRVSILEVISKVQLCILMWDFECDSLILEMFNQFLHIRRSDHAMRAILHMAKVMTLMIDESDEISDELLCCLLDSMKEDHKELFPTGHELGVRVIGNCSEKLKPYFINLSQSKDTSFSDYIKIIESISQDKSYSLEKDVVNDSDVDMADDNLSRRIISNKLPQADDDSSERTISDKLPQEESEKQELEINSAKELSSTRDMTQKPVVESGARSSRGQKRKASGQQTGTSDPNDTSIGDEMVRKLRIRKAYRSPNFLYLYPQKESDIDFILGLEEKKTHRKSARSAGGRPAGSKNGRSGCVGITIKNPIPPTGEKESEMKNQTEEGAPASEAFVPNTVGDSINNTEGKATEKNKVSEGLGEALVGAKIKVCWPKDKKFYKGVVVSYDPTIKKHTILYDDGDKEVLLMEEECWQLLKLPKRVRPRATTSGFPYMSMVGFI